jgi:predicted MFS family arabinose efflux permease
LRLADIGSLLRNPRFLAVTLLTAIPSKLILTGFLYYAMPLYLSRLELSAGDVGRVIMTYGLAMILFSPLVGYLADVWGRRAGFVAVGGLLAALAILLVEQQASALLAVLGIVLLGTAQAIGVSPQLTLVMDVSHTDIARIGAGTVMGIFRLLERIGNILGPIVVALLIDALGFEGAFVALGLYALLSVALFGMIWLAFTQRERRAACPPSDSALLGQAVRSGSVA